jgi:hypothetical protein
MEHETGTIAIAIMSTLILAFGLWVIHKITNI